MSYQPRLFLSYSWAYSEQANYLEEALKMYGIQVTRDVNDLRAWGSITEFMNSIREHDFTVILIGHDYLCSESCMYEMMVASNDVTASKNILSVVVDNTIYNRDTHLEYVEYWDNVCKGLKEQISHAAVDWSSALTETIERVKRLEKIRNYITKFIQNIADMNNPKLEFAAQEIINRVASSIAEYEITQHKSTPTHLNKRTVGEAMLIKNELINWYFPDPINQRLHQEYGTCMVNNVTRGLYTIDCWYLYRTGISNSACIRLENNGIVCNCDSKDSPAYLVQKIEAPQRFSGQTITVSVNVVDIKFADAFIELRYSTYKSKRGCGLRKRIDSEGIISSSVLLPENLTNLEVALVFSGGCADSRVVFSSVKLELGSESSLAHELPPLRSEELRRCQRYTLRVPKGYHTRAELCDPRGFMFKIQTPVDLRITPTIVNRNAFEILPIPCKDTKSDAVKVEPYMASYERGSCTLFLYTSNPNFWNDATLQLAEDAYFDCDL